MKEKKAAAGTVADGRRDAKGSTGAAGTGATAKPVAARKKAGLCINLHRPNEIFGCFTEPVIFARQMINNAHTHHHHTYQYW